MGVELFALVVLALLVHLTLGAGLGWWFCNRHMRSKSLIKFSVSPPIEQAAEALIFEAASNEGDRHAPVVSTDRKPSALAAPIVDAKAVLADETKSGGQARQDESTTAKAGIDRLTGLATRGTFDEYLQRQYGEWSRSEQPFSLLMIDVDAFKEISDKHGHLIGDGVLRQVSGVLRQMADETSVVARYGREEFAIIHTHSTIAATTLAERIRKEVDGLYFPALDSELHLTVSLGLAQVAAGDTTESLICHAAEALSAAKQDGRNCTYLHNGIGCERITVRRPVHDCREIEDLEAQNNPSGNNLENRRRSKRLPLRGLHQIAPYDGQTAPRQECFFEVECHDIATGGFSFIAPTFPRFKMMVVVLGSPPRQKMLAAEVCNQSPIMVNDRPMIRVGCRFIHCIEQGVLQIGLSIE